MRHKTRIIIQAVHVLLQLKTHGKDTIELNDILQEMAKSSVVTIGKSTRESHDGKSAFSNAVL